MSNEDLRARADKILAETKKRRQLEEEAKLRNEETRQRWEDHQLTKAEWGKFFSEYRRLPKQAKSLVNMLGIGAYNGQSEEDLQGILAMEFSPGQAEKGKEIFQQADSQCRNCGLVEDGLVPLYSAKTTEGGVTKLVNIYQGEAGRHLSPANYQALKVISREKSIPQN